MMGVAGLVAPWPELRGTFAPAHPDGLPEKEPVRPKKPPPRCGGLHGYVGGLVVPPPPVVPVPVVGSVSPPTPFPVKVPVAGAPTSAATSTLALGVPRPVAVS